MFEELCRTAEVYFLIKQKSKRARTKFIKITDWKQEGDTYTFYAMFQGKNQIRIHKVTIHKDGSIVE